MNLLLEHGGSWLLGATALLAGGCLLVAVSRQPLHRRRLGEAVGWVLLAWLLLLPWPLPRPLSVAAPAASPAAVTDPLPRGSRAPAAGRERPLRETSAEFGPAPVRAEATGSSQVPPVSSALPGRAAAPARSWPVLLWLAGATLCAMWLLLGALRLRLLVRRSRPVPEWVAALVAVPGRVRLRITDARVRPMCCGWRRPVVLLPAALCARQQAATVRQVLRHELAHVRQGDGRCQWLFACLLPPLFFHPLLWWLRRQVRRDAEAVADEMAAVQSERSTYARELIQLAQGELSPARVPGGVAVFHRGSEFYRRMEMLLRREKPLSLSISRPRRLLHLCCTAALLVVGAGLWGRPLPAQDPGGTELATLRAERDRLRQEVAELRAMVAELTGQHAAPAVPQAGAGFFEVEVQAGQTLHRILREYFQRVDGALLERVRALNPGLDPRRLRVGQKIRVPADGPASQPEPESPLLQETYVDQDTVRTALRAAQVEAPVPSVASVQIPPLVPVLELVTRAIDLRGELEIAVARVEELAAQDKPTRVAELQVRTAEAKLRVVEGLLRSERDAAAMELHVVDRQLQELDPEDPERTRLEIHKRRLEQRIATLRAGM